jgi:hypothetical protein
MRKALVIAVAVGFLAPALCAAADWQFIRAQGNLRMVQVINGSNARVAVSRPELPNTPPYLVFKAPKGARVLEECPGKACPPLKIQVDGRATHTLPVDPSIKNTNALAFFIPKGSTLLQEMKAGNSMTVSFQEAASGKTRTEKFSLKGITASLAQLDKAMGGS